MPKEVIRAVLKAALLVLIIIVPLLLMFQGLDMTDTGFVIVNQQNIFSSPESVSYWFHLWLTNIIGGTVYLLFGNWGLLPFRFFSCLIYWTASLFIYLAFRKRIRTELILLGIALGMVSFFGGKINIIHYNSLTMLFFVIAGFFLISGCERESFFRVFLAGAFAGLNVFVRFPNALGLFFFVLIILYGLWFRRGAVPIFKEVTFFLAGYAAACCTVVLTMKMLGHLQLYLDSLRILFGESAGNAESGYRALSVLFRPVRDNLKAAFFGLIAILAVGCVSRAAGLIQNKTLRFFLYVLAAAVVYLSQHYGLFLTNRLRFSIPGLIYYALFGIIFLYQKQGSFYRFAALVSGFIIVAMSFGSDTVLNVSEYAYALALPLVFHFFDTFWKDGKEGEPRVLFWFRTAYSHALPAVLSIFIAVNIFGLYHRTYRDGPRAAMRYQTISPMLKGIRTIEARAAVIDELLPVLQTYVQEGDELLAYDSIPMIHFITKTRPYLRNPWPVLYLPGEFGKVLAEQEKTRALPAVLLTKSNPRTPSWPKNTNVHENPDTKLLQDFLARNGYTVVWESSAFRIFLPVRN